MSSPTAVLSYLIASKKMGERDRLGKLTVSEGGTEVSVSVTVVAQTGESSSIELAAQVLGASLIAHCIKRKIPLPKRANKSITSERRAGCSRILHCRRAAEKEVTPP